jgi:amidohydrolase
MKFDTKAKEYEKYIIDLRRDFHINAELSLKEFRTSKVVCDELDKMGIPYVRIENGVVGRIQGEHSGKRIAIRADMDALPVVEENDVSYKSQNEGVMHACGHDGHTAMLLGAAKMLSEVREELNGEVFLCFQSAEEIGQGANELIGYLEEQGGVDEVIAAHLWSGISSGNISIIEGPRMAAASGYHVEVTGRGGHGSRPDLCIDPIRPAANILLAISSIPTNRYTTLEPLVIHTCMLQAGTMGNIFPQTATMSGSMRFFSIEGEKKARELIKETAEKGAEMYGAKAKVSFIDGIPTVYNHKDSVARAENVLEELNTFKMVTFEQICASENFGLYLKKYKGFMAFIGIRNEEKGLIYEQHHHKFDIDEDVLSKGSEFFAQYAFNFLNK